MSLFPQETRTNLTGMNPNRRKDRPWKSATFPPARWQPFFGVTAEYLQEKQQESGERYVCISPLDDHRKKRRINFRRYRRLALVVSVASVYITVILSISGFIVSFTSQSAGEFAFAADAILGSVSSIMIIWRFYNSEEQLHPEKDKKACFIISLCFIATAFIMLGDTIVNLAEEKKVRNTDAMVAISIIGFACFTALFMIKYWVAEKLHSKALKADSYDSAAGGANSLGLVVSTFVYETNSQVWFLDDAVALLITAATLVYGVKLNYEVSCSNNGNSEHEGNVLDNDDKNIKCFEVEKKIAKLKGKFSSARSGF